jgi:pimeloyl-ACP methyl ester carboxylesterase
MHSLIRAHARRRLYACIATAALCSTAAAQSITPGQGINIAGSHTFSVTPPVSGQIVWTVDRETRSEKGSGTVEVRRNLYRSTTASPTFDLSKIAGQETVYSIRATNGAFTDARRVQVFQADELSSFWYRDTAHAWIQTRMVVPATLSSRTRMLFVMHGAGRDAVSYCGPWVEWAQAQDYILVCPVFDNRRWPSDAGYNLGALFRNKSETQANNEEAWSFSVVEQMHARLRNSFGLASPHFDIWGHSAGGQFVTRFVLFRPAAPVRLALAANPGWYLLPNETATYPCGPVHDQLDFSRQDLQYWTRRTMVIFRGTEDLSRKDLDVRGCMDSQGEHRYARAKTFHNAAKAFDPDTRWQLVDVPGIGHDAAGMTPAAQDFIRNYNATGEDPI